jgi:Predicted signal transduction protein with a C-terminal ATPase domain
MAFSKNAMLKAGTSLNLHKIKLLDRFLLRSRLIVAFSLLTAGSLIILGAVCYWISYTKILEQSKTYNAHIADQLGNNVNLYFSEILSVANTLSYDSKIKYYGKYLSTSSSESNLNDIKLVLFNLVAQKPDIDNISILYNKSLLISTYNTYDLRTIDRNAYYYNLNDIYLNANILPYSEKNETGEYVFSAVKSVYSPDERASFESIIDVNFSFDQLDMIFNNLKNEKNMIAYITDRHGNIEYAASRNLIGGNVYKNAGHVIPANNSTGVITVGNEKFVVSTIPLSDCNMYVVTTVPLRNVVAAAKSIKTLSLIFILIFIIVTCVISIIVSSKFTKPLMKLVDKMTTVGEGIFTTEQNVTGSPEIRRLYLKFNDMVEKINLLMQDVNEKNFQKRKAEIYALQSQISPHFLYNTLDTITSMATLAHNGEIRQMTVSLAKLLRLSLNNVEYVKIRDEVQHVKSYINIQSIRFKNKFDVQYELDDEALDFYVIKLILQPLVENSIYHGLEIKEDKGHITIRAVREGELVRLTVLDDGIGMDEATLEAVRKRLEKSNQFMEQKNIGIINVNERIRQYYGDEYGLKILSKPNEGTRIDILLPQNREGNRHDSNTDCG